MGCSQSFLMVIRNCPRQCLLTVVGTSVLHLLLCAQEGNKTTINKFTMQVSIVASLKNENIGNFCACCVFLFMEANTVISLMMAGERGGTTLNASCLSMPGVVCSTALHGLWPNREELFLHSSRVRIRDKRGACSSPPRAHHCCLSSGCGLARSRGRRMRPRQHKQFILALFSFALQLCSEYLQHTCKTVHLSSVIFTQGKKDSLPSAAFLSSGLFGDGSSVQRNKRVQVVSSWKDRIRCFASLVDAFSSAI
ncbi:hypothetical protein EK904_013531, partial [Melospiza melodia maxima]